MSGTATSPVIFDYTGAVVTYTVPASGAYEIIAAGAQGGGSGPATAGGEGVATAGAFLLTAGETLDIVVGGMGTTDPNAGSGGGGGGGSFVVAPGDLPLLVAGGGGGAAGTPATGGYADTAGDGVAPIGFGSSGGGFISGGAGAGGGASFLAGAAGGSGTYPGGFGGGGGTVDAGLGGPGSGGGGGFTGGSGGGYYAIPYTFLGMTYENDVYFGGTGGGSVDNGLAPLVLADANAGNGFVEIVALPCFCAGTRLATPAGEAAVETLRAGDHLLTRDGRAAPIVWIGRRTITVARQPTPARVQPIRVRAGAFADGVPSRDLYLSPDHAVFAGGVLIPVKYLITGDAVAPVAVDVVTYLHVELDRHEVVWAEGLLVESYLDTGDRAGLGLDSRGLDSRGLVGLGRDEQRPSNAACANARWEAAGYAPLVVSGETLTRVRARLAARQGAAVPPGGDGAAGRSRPDSALAMSVGTSTVAPRSLFIS